MKGNSLKHKFIIFILLFLSCCQRISTKEPLDLVLESYYNDFEKKDMTPNFLSNRHSYFGDLNYLYKQIINQQNQDSNAMTRDECLVPEKDTQRILKDVYGVTDKKDDRNLRFILGQCNPVVLIPGIYSTKLMVTINCKKLSEENEKRLMEMRLFCDKDICADMNKEEEEHVLFPSLLASPFSLLKGQENLYSTCLGYFQKYFNKNKECPRMKDQSEICLFSEAVKISFYGGTNRTKDNSRCGLSAIQNIINSGLSSFIDELINQKSSRVFGPMIEAFKKLGFSEGFSLAGIPYDYRRFVSTNTFAMEAFKSHINNLYSNTGKPVVIIAHSFGTIHTLNYLLKEDKTMLPKIKKFVAIGPPFAGATKLLDIFLNGNHDFDLEYKIWGIELIVKLDSLGQGMMYNTIPTTIELRPQAIFTKLMKNPKYQAFGTALKERWNMEERLANDEPISNDASSFFSTTFTGIPSLSDKECQPNTSNKFLEGQPPVYSNACKLNIHNILDCPAMFIDKSTGLGAKALENSCGRTDASFLYTKQCDDSNQSCLDKLFSQAPYPYTPSPKLDELIKRFNTNHASTFKKTIDYSFFESKTTFQSKMPMLIDYYHQISKTHSLIIPPIDTMIIYSKFDPTSTAYSYNPSQSFEKGFGLKEIQFTGGDGTVPTWSSYLTGLKWLYDKKIDSLPQDITLVEYCSPLSQSQKYGYQEQTKKSFYAIGCECLNQGYDMSKIQGGYCEHASMIGDPTLIEHIKDAAISDKSNMSDITEDRKESVRRYNGSVNYEANCNNRLKDLNDKE